MTKVCIHVHRTIKHNEKVKLWLFLGLRYSGERYLLLRISQKPACLLFQNMGKGTVETL